MAELGKLARYPRRLCAYFQSHSRFAPFAKVFRDGFHVVAEGAFLHRYAFLIENRVLAHLVAQIHANRLGWMPLHGFAILLHGWFSFAPLCVRFTAYRCIKVPNRGSHRYSSSPLFVIPLFFLPLFVPQGERLSY
jgi:hypothetical protein